MYRKTLLATALAVLMAGSASFVMAQNAPAATPSGTTTSQSTAAKNSTAHHGDRHSQRMSHDGKRGHGMSRGFDGRRGGVIGDLRALERLYMQAGRSKDLAPLYNDVLSKSQNPQVRDYVYHRLARLQAQPANVDQAIATLRKGLDENLANEAKMRAEHEKMRAAWQSRQGKAAPAQ